MGDFKHRQILTVVTPTSGRFLALFLFRMCEVCARVAMLAVLAARRHGLLGAVGLTAEVLGLCFVFFVTRLAAGQRRGHRGDAGSIPGWAWYAADVTLPLVPVIARPWSA